MKNIIKKSRRSTAIKPNVVPLNVIFEHYKTVRNQKRAIKFR